MFPKIGNPWISSDRIAELVQIERIVVILALALVSWAFYRIFLKRVTSQRHTLLQKDFANLGFHCALTIVLTAGTFGLFHLGLENIALLRIGTYLGVFAIFSGALVFVKTCRIFAFEYLFLSHMREGVPVLLINLLTLFLFLVIAGWAANSIFNVRLAPLLATSAIFSLVLGLALQDTLGNPYADVALQLDKPYEIVDWIDVTTSAHKSSGRVQEISWRCTVLR
ncbi:mechanosensitive ion channel family protein, partial [Bdellovibrionota bacterium FG-2]